MISLAGFILGCNGSSWLTAIPGGISSLSLSPWPTPSASQLRDCGIAVLPQVMKPSVDRREDDLSPAANVAPRLHLAGAVPVMPGLTPILSSPAKRAPLSTPSTNNGYHANGDHTELADAIDGIQLSPSRRQHPIPLNSGIGETVVCEMDSTFIFKSPL